MLSLQQRGFSLIELLIGLVVLGIVMMIGMPSLATWIQNTQIRNQAEAVYSGLQMARAEALRRNTQVRFQLFDTLNAGCAASTSGKSWVVSLADSSGQCNLAPADTAPQIIQKKDGAEGSTNTALAATGGALVTFNGLGRVVNVGPLTQVNITNPVGGACKTAAGAEPMRCLRIQVASGGQMRMCDPAVTAATDPRRC
jgi:type IV fimbrial biogenesis protein FimT